MVQATPNGTLRSLGVMPRLPRSRVTNDLSVVSSPSLTKEASPPDPRSAARMFFYLSAKTCA